MDKNKSIEQGSQWEGPVSEQENNCPNDRRCNFKQPDEPIFWIDAGPNQGGNKNQYPDVFDDSSPVSLPSGDYAYAGENVKEYTLMQTWIWQ